ncbi:hypothetical protein Adt_14956 [Abeliophyllum distichum]|uniref:DUF7734 domain-containing protein n=1 Tax=Abeliophyllum distichum TaxID=126358 RepID=A0ABD1U136_9LAMI
MLKHSGIWTALSFPHRLLPLSSTTHNNSIHIPPSFIFSERVFAGLLQCNARRRAVYHDNDEDKEYQQNEELGLLETYTQSVKDEVLLVKAIVDGEEAEVLVFKGFSSCLSYKTSANPSTSVIPARAVIKSIDRIKGPFDPSNIQYIEKGLTLEAFKTRLRSY